MRRLLMAMVVMALAAGTVRATGYHECPRGNNPGDYCCRCLELTTGGWCDASYISGWFYCEANAPYQGCRMVHPGCGVALHIGADLEPMIIAVQTECRKSSPELKVARPS